MKHIDAGPYHYWVAADAQDYWYRAEYHEPAGEFLRSSRQKCKTRDDFTKTKDFEEAMSLARYGWQEGLKRIAPVSVRIGDAIGRYVKRESMSYDVTGEFPCVSSYIQGQPESMIRLDDSVESGRGKIVRVVYNGSASSGVPASVMEKRGAVAAAVVDAIGRAGLLAELEYCVWTKYTNPKPYGIRVPIKRSDEPLNMDRLAFILAHPAMLRRVQFSVWETIPDGRDYGFHGGTYGNVAEAPEELRGDIHFPAMCSSDKEWLDDAVAEKKTLAMLKEIGLLEE